MCHNKFIITVHLEDLTNIVVRLFNIRNQCVSPNIQDGVTAFDAASLGGHAHVVDILMKAGADANPMVSS